MDGLTAAALTALWLGVLTSISPCPMASNIAAVSFVGRNLERRSAALLGGLLYTLGRTVTYVAVAAVVVSGALSVPSLAFFLQKTLNRALGPMLVLVGLVLLGALRIPMPSLGGGGRLQALAGRGGLWGPLLLGLVFALSFCPTSAALFFGSLIPLAMEKGSRLLLPAAYGVGTAAPVALFAVLLAQGAHAVARAFSLLSTFEKWARRITGAVFLLAGAYYILAYWLGVSLW